MSVTKLLSRLCSDSRMQRQDSLERSVLPELAAAAQSAPNRAVPLDALNRVVQAHRDQASPRPERALLPRPRSPEIAVDVPGLGKRAARLYYDLEGGIEARFQDALRGPSPYTLRPAGTQTRLTAGDIDAIGAKRAELESKFSYSTAAAALAIVRAVRHARRLGHGPSTFAAAARELDLRGSQVLEAYQGGTCMSLAEALQEHIEATYQIKAYVSSERNPVFQQPSADSSKAVRNQAFLDSVHNDTHLNTFVPFHREDGSVAFLKVAVGFGPTDLRNVAGRTTLAQVGLDQVPAQEVLRQRGKLPHEVLVGRPGRLGVDSVAGCTKLNMMRWETGETFGIDLLRQIAYLNQKATPAGQPGMALDLKQPAGLAQLDLFLATVKQVFKLPSESIADLDHLCRNLGTFAQEVLLGPAPILASVIHERDASVALRHTFDAILGSALSIGRTTRVVVERCADAGDAAIKEAGTCVEKGDVAGSKRVYALAMGHYRAALAACVQGVATVPQKALANLREQLYEISQDHPPIKDALRQVELRIADENGAGS